ncbi:class I SAM-dependent methyltransferase [Mycobacterium sp. Aquia_216]|uniref:O-methyltransferase n=1 Tax=Mycobacterium sp. Aquia_216 TaxID=2991729 RepID=UPI00227C3912|nr:class I SAM-dependent methyltransferase [Mycobacterium sp. Aquia_216]WAJ44345.1 class I SAM-dependent methyltransferase [Mycobacterium sp. Aquia_216]
MNSLDTPQVSGVLERLFGEADQADQPFITSILEAVEPGIDPVTLALAAESKDYRGFYHQAVGNFLCVSPEYGRFLYVCARAAAARRVVEFGTSFGVSAIYLACAVRDNGGGTVIGTELESSKAARAYDNLRAAGVADVVDIWIGDALDALCTDLGGEVDLVHLDGALSLYRPVLEILEPKLRPNALVIAENATPDYLAYVRDPDRPYLSLTLPFRDGSGNELSLFTG